MKIYVAGKVTGEKVGDVFSKFNAVAYRIRQKGHQAINPMEICSPAWSWERCMKECLLHLVECDALYLLSDWQWSKGARLEKEVAEGLGLPILKKINQL